MNETCLAVSGNQSINQSTVLINQSLYNLISKCFRLIYFWGLISFTTKYKAMNVLCKPKIINCTDMSSIVLINRY